ncbi:MAG TPA: hypothetical protein VKF62_14710 [Planctomycetota bacterium]|nr:hypothetical protein [Planctomycetota bacterium]
MRRTSRRTSLLTAAGLLLAAAPARAQAPTIAGAVRLTGLGIPTNRADPFGLAVSPDGFLWVAVAGNSCLNPPTCNNNVVAKIDPAAMSVVGTVAVGFFPEEIAFVVDPSQPGVPRWGWVTVNGDGTVVRFGANPSLPDYLTVTAVLPFPPPGQYGPFGIAAHPTYPFVFVGDFNCGGIIRAIESITPTYVPAADISVPGCHGRLAFAGNLLIVPTTDYSNFPEVCVSVSAVQPLDPSAVWTRCLGCSTTGYPSGQDVATNAAGEAFVLPYDLGERVHLFDPAAGGLVRTIATGLGFANQGIGISPDGSLVAVTDFFQNSVLFIDGVSHQLLAVVPFGPYLSPNDVVFLGGDAWVTAQNSEAVVRITNLPTPVPSPYAFTLAASESTPALGGTTTITLTGGSPEAILFSTADVPAPIGGGLALEIGAFSVVAAGGGPALSITVPIPTIAGLECTPIFLQGIGAVGASPAVSNPITVIPQ